jgi:hypothetical protein
MLCKPKTYILTGGIAGFLSMIELNALTFGSAFSINFVLMLTKA